MALRALITTRDLLFLHPDLHLQFFSDCGWQSGSDGVLDGTPIPANFTSTTGNFLFYTPDGRDAVSPTIPVVLNIPTVGFYSVISVPTNNTLNLAEPSAAVLRSVNQWLGEDLTQKGVPSGSKLDWSLGGWEAQIMAAYQTLCGDLVSRDKAPSIYDENEGTFVEALTAKALANVYTALTREMGDNSEKLATMYAHKYIEFINTRRSLKAIDGDAVATFEFDRNG